MALQQFVAWLLGRVNNCRAGNPITCNHHWTRHQLTNTLYHSKGLDQRSGSNPFERSGSEVWIGGLDRVWERGLIQTLHFEPQPFSFATFWRIGLLTRAIWSHSGNAQSFNKHLIYVFHPMSTHMYPRCFYRSLYVHLYVSVLASNIIYIITR